MKQLLVPVLFVLSLAALPKNAGAQPQPKHVGTPPSDNYTPQKPEFDLRQLLMQIDRNRLQSTVQTLVNFGTRHTASSQTDPNRGIGAATQWVFQQFQAAAASSGGRMTVAEQTFTQPASPNIPVPTTITNIIATLTGSASPNRIYVVAAHLDSRVTDVLNFTDNGPGADDDASGVAVVLELARVMAPLRLKATVVFTVVDGEEQGLYGSTFQARQYAAAGADIEGMLNNDTVGSSTAEDGSKDAREIRLFTEGVPTAITSSGIATMQAAGGENDSSSRELGRFVKSVAENSQTGMNIWLINRRDRYLKGSDQISYQAQGYPAARFTEPNENFNHEHQNVIVQSGVQFGDLISFMDFDYLAGVARVNAATMWSLAQGPGTPKNLTLSVNVPFNSPNSANSTTLTWSAVADADLAGYEVVWREMDDVDWTQVVPVGNVTTVTFPFFPKDNYIIGLRAVDTDGHHSPVAYPTLAP
jgi:putative aminopeptidase FrvX